jgi:hypothetical protein
MSLSSRLQAWTLAINQDVGKEPTPNTFISLLIRYAQQGILLIQAYITFELNSFYSTYFLFKIIISRRTRKILSC